MKKEKKSLPKYSENKLKNLADGEMALRKKLEELTGKKLEAKKTFDIVYLVIDTSGSMSLGDKIKQAQSGAVDFARAALSKGYYVGLIIFSSFAKHILEPQSTIDRFIIETNGLIANGSTNMADAIQMASQHITDADGEKIMCIVTDGMPDDERAALLRADEAKKNGIEIMTIGTDDADRDFLARLATRKELSKKVIRQELERGIAHMAKMLPDKTKEQR